MKKLFIISIILGALCAAFVGCSTGPERATFNAEKIIVSTAAGARDAWAQYYVHQRQVLTDPVALAKLETTRAQVNAAWFHYTQAVTIIVLGQEAGFANTNGVVASVEAGISAAAQPLITLVQSLLKQ